MLQVVVLILLLQANSVPEFRALASGQTGTSKAEFRAINPDQEADEGEFRQSEAELDELEYIERQRGKR